MIVSNAYWSDNASRVAPPHRGRSPGTPTGCVMQPLESRTMLSAGALDPTFGRGGMVALYPGSSSGGGDAIATQADGKTVLAGFYSDANGKSNVVVMRLSIDGSLDATFGAKGRVVLSAPSMDLWPKAVEVQSDGRIVVAVASSNPKAAVPGNFMLVRYLRNGVPDRTFGLGGTVITAFPGGSSQVSAIVFSGTKIVAAGSLAYSKPIKDNSGEFAVARYLGNGQLDTTFGTGGRAITDMIGGSDEADAITVQPDGKILVGGTAELIGALRGQGSIFAVARYATSGKLDSTFSQDGRAFARIAGSDTITSLAVQKDGDILACGDTNDHLALARWLGNGTPDTSFGRCGVVQTALTANFAQADNMALQADGRIVLAGGGSSFTVARFTTFGAVDNTFGISGQATTDFGYGGALAACIAIQPRDGKIVAFGFLSSMRYFELARYLT